MNLAYSAKRDAICVVLDETEVPVPGGVCGGIATPDIVAALSPVLSRMLPGWKWNGQIHVTVDATFVSCSVAFLAGVLVFNLTLQDVGMARTGIISKGPVNGVCMQVQILANKAAVDRWREEHLVTPFNNPN